MAQPPLLWLINTLIDFYVFLLVASVVLSWLVAFQVVNLHNRIVRAIAEALERLTEPALRPVRRYVPIMGGLDLSPLVVMLALFFVQYTLNYYWLG